MIWFQGEVLISSEEDSGKGTLVDMDSHGNFWLDHIQGSDKDDNEAFKAGTGAERERVGT